MWRDHSADAPRSSTYATSEAPVKKVKQIEIITFETESRFPCGNERAVRRRNARILLGDNNL
jgi:hypothetical protein